MNKNISMIRQTFLDFFYEKKHKIMESSSLILKNDPTLLFTNAGMNQFKNIFLGTEKIKYKRIATAQRCLRIGGKHNDLEYVGYTTRHHTFFEMLGNFSFGDYFKEEAISFAWELLTSHKWFNLNKEKIWITVYYKDNESFNIWNKKIGIKKNKIIKIGENNETSDNFWQMGNTGPCGPCTEIFFDRSDKNDKETDFHKKQKNEKCIEIWNIVFIQFNKTLHGKLIPLKITSVDTGMGLERIASVLQNVDSNYQTDLFKKLIKEIAIIINVNQLESSSLKIIADHIRSAVFLISDGVLPSNTKHGYILRKIIRRAIRHGYLLGVKKLFFYKLITPLIKVMNTYNKKIQEKKEIVKKIIKSEEKKFNFTFHKGLKILNQKIKNIGKKNILKSDFVFKLYDTFGFPVDLTEEICKEKSIKINKNNIIKKINQQRLTSQKNNFFKKTYQFLELNNFKTIYTGYKKLIQKTIVKFIFTEEGEQINIINSLNTKGIVVLEKTSFYGESGGQIGDIGELKFYKNNFVVLNTKKQNNAILHFGKLISGKIEVGDPIICKVNKKYRHNISKNHTATHLLNESLKRILSDKIEQKGSLVNEKYLRFDFSYNKKIKNNQIKIIENLVNKKILENLKIKTYKIPFKNAKEKNINYLLEENYEDNVRVININNFSKELCCGTHIKNSIEIGFFKIIKEYGVSSGVRRIEAITGKEFLKQINKHYEEIQNIALLLNTSIYNIKNKIDMLIKNNYKFEKDLKKIKKQYIQQQILIISDNIFKVKNINLLITQINHLDYSMLREIINILKNNLKKAILIITTNINDKLFFMIGITENLKKHFQADVLAKNIFYEMGGKGGGNEILAQGQIINTSLVKDLLIYIKKIIFQKIQKINDTI